MSDKAITEKIYRVGNESSIRNGGWIEVGPDREGVGCVEVRTVGHDAEEYYGKLSLTLPPATARALGRALLGAADDVDAEGTP